MMSIRRTTLVVLVGVVLLIGVLAFFPQTSATSALLKAVNWGLNAILVFVAFILFFFGSWGAGLTTFFLVSDKEALSKLVIVSVYSLVAGAIQYIAFTIFLEEIPAFHNFMALFHGAGPFETQPWGWAVVGIAAYGIGYACGFIPAK